ncbi:MAG: hypothetical protein J5I90_08955 [Caldilineales bacterium]|nr:hypothetical protein [Caldilineales bacterium]
MAKLFRRDWRPYHRQLILGAALALVLIPLFLTIQFAPASAGKSSPDAGAIAGLAGGYQSPDRCRECHEAEYQAWSGTLHAEASFDPIFQTYLAQEEQPGECLGCHTTGYNTSTGRFVLAGVSCEACHGPYRVDHPGQSMMIVSSEELCGHCHTSTLAEWASSRHGEKGVNCIKCHEVHSQSTRQDVITNALCAGCHEAGTQDAVHSDHLARGLHCVDCHLSRPLLDPDSSVSGYAPTGHAFTVAVSTCSLCHNELPRNGDSH